MFSMATHNMTYTVKHLHSHETFQRPPILLNAAQRSRDWPLDIDPAIGAFHKHLPSYGETRIHALPELAACLGLRHVFLKDESTRFGLPSFKILGASWAIHRAICEKLNVPSTTSLTELTERLKARHDLRLVSCTEGNWGRAVSRMAKYLAVPATIYVPGFMDESTRSLILNEGADVRVIEDGSYDDTITAVRHDAQTTGAMMVLDTSWEDYEEIPKWVTEGYSTMLEETDRQISALTNGRTPNLAFVSVGVGCWAHAVVAHYKAKSTGSQVVTVEPNTAASFKESLHCNSITPIETGNTIMHGMNCGTTSTIAWPVLRDGTHAAVTVWDHEAHECVQYLRSKSVNAGPCGAATLAALKRYCAEIEMQDTDNLVVVLFSTEGNREYEVPDRSAGS